jgi:hypothetical protein
MYTICGSDMEDKCKIEIQELHSFFENWFNGVIAKTRPNFERVSEVLHPNFNLIPPSGKIVSRKRLLEMIWDAHDSRKHSNDLMKIWIKNFRFQQMSETHFLVVYEEWQRINDADKGRISTAIMMKQDNSYQDLIWYSVHETWLTE